MAWVGKTEEMLKEEVWLSSLESNFKTRTSFLKGGEVGGGGHLKSTFAVVKPYLLINYVQY